MSFLSFKVRFEPESEKKISRFCCGVPFSNQSRAAVAKSKEFSAQSIHSSILRPVVSRSFSNCFLRAISGSATSLSKVPPPQASVQAATTSMNRAPIVTPLADQTGLFNATVAIVCINPETAGTFGTVNYGTGVKRLHPDQ